MLSRGIKPGQVLTPTIPQDRVGTEVTSPCNCGRRKPNFKRSQDGRVVKVGALGGTHD